MKYLSGLGLVVFGAILAGLLVVTGASVSPYLANVIWGPANAGALVLYLGYLVGCSVVSLALSVATMVRRQVSIALAFTGALVVFSYVLNPVLAALSIAGYCSSIVLLIIGFSKMREPNTTG